MIRVFLDANVYFAGCYSPTGASAWMLTLARQKHVTLVASRLVLREAERNLRQKSTQRVVGAFRRFLRETKVMMMPTLPDQVLARYEHAIHPKDVPVLASAVEAKVDYLLTLDRKHFMTTAARAAAGRVKIATPGECLRLVVRRHLPAPRRVSTRS